LFRDTAIADPGHNDMAEYRDYLMTLSPTEILDRLSRDVGTENILGCLDGTTTPVVGYVRSNRFRLRAPRGFQNNALQPYLYGRLIPHPEGTLVRTRLSMHPFATGMIIAIVGGLVVSALAGLVHGNGSAFFGAAGMTVLVLFFAKLCRWMDRDHEETLWRFADSIFGSPPAPTSLRSSEMPPCHAFRFHDPPTPPG